MASRASKKIGALSKANRDRRSQKDQEDDQNTRANTCCPARVSGGEERANEPIPDGTPAAAAPPIKPGFMVVLL